MTWGEKSYRNYLFISHLTVIITYASQFSSSLEEKVLKSRHLLEIALCHTAASIDNENQTKHIKRFL